MEEDYSDESQDFEIEKVPQRPLPQIPISEFDIQEEEKIEEVEEMEDKEKSLEKNEEEKFDEDEEKNVELNWLNPYTYVMLLSYPTTGSEYSKLSQSHFVDQRRRNLTALCIYTSFMRFCSFDAFLMCLILSSAMVLYYMKNSRKISMQMAKSNIKKRVGWAKQWAGSFFRKPTEPPVETIPEETKKQKLLSRLRRPPGPRALAQKGVMGSAATYQLVKRALLRKKENTDDTNLTISAPVLSDLPNRNNVKSQ